MTLRLDPADFEFQGRSIPEHMHRCIREYLVDHQLDEHDFLAAIVLNDLRRAVAVADQVNLWAIPVYVAYFHNHAPYTCWGTAERVRAWLAEAPIEVQPTTAIITLDVPEGTTYTFTDAKPPETGNDE